uniref:Uncharacterized protein n=1 Tax=Lepeophtheirus salmonis TaxID=72036 RepID=A0A0K2T6U4_LEPSM
MAEVSVPLIVIKCIYHTHIVHHHLSLTLFFMNLLTLFSPPHPIFLSQTVSVRVLLLPRLCYVYYNSELSSLLLLLFNCLFIKLYYCIYYTILEKESVSLLCHAFSLSFNLKTKQHTYKHTIQLLS